MLIDIPPKCFPLTGRFEFRVEDGELMFVYYYVDNKWDHAAASTPLGEISYRLGAKDGEVYPIAEIKSPFGNYDATSTDPRSLAIGEMIAQAKPTLTSFKRVDTFISDMFFRVIDKLQNYPGLSAGTRAPAIPRQL